MLCWAARRSAASCGTSCWSATNRGPIASSRPPSASGALCPKDNNDHPNHLRHDVRLLKVNVVVFSRPGTTALVGAIDATATEIAVDSVADAHPSGFIQIESEYIEYDGLDKTNNRFLNCTRGIEGSTAASHADNSPALYSTTTPVVSRSQVMEDLTTIDERFAQSTIRLARPVSINMGGTGRSRSGPPVGVSRRLRCRQRGPIAESYRG